MLAALKGHNTVVARVIELGADVGLSDAGGRQAAHWACMGRGASTLELLLDAGASLNVQTNMGVTLLMCAACYGATDCVKLLLARGGDALELDAQMSYGWTALYSAAIGGFSQVVQLLLLAGADPTVRTNNGETPLDIVQASNNHACIPLLHAATAEPQRPRLLKARALLDAAIAVRAARIDARTRAGGRCAAVAAAPAYLKQRVAEGRELPAVTVIERGQENEQLVACIKYALGLEGGGMVLFEGQEPVVGMLPEVFVEMCELVVPKWDRRNV